MNEKLLDQLDYNRIKNEIASFCVSAEGKTKIEEMKPSSDAVLIEKNKAISSEWAYLIKYSSVRLLSWNEVRKPFGILGIDNACLSTEEAFSIYQFCLSVNALTEHFGSGSDYAKTCPTISGEIQKLYALNEVQDKISRLIDANGEIREVSEIREIKNTIRKKKNEIEKTMKNYTSSPEFQDYLQSSLPVLRSGRQVLAVKANYKGRIKGIVHEVSQSGNTFYIEPETVVQISNELFEEEARLLRQIKLMFADLTCELSSFKDKLIRNLYFMENLDVCYAGALWGIQNKCSYAKNCNFDVGENLSLLKARHPLLAEKAVPIDVSLSKDVRVLIISGANTGGKTVTLKTIALFSLLNQSGFPIPCVQDSILPVFSDVFADIGDEQSLDESLSTFSAHMKNVAYALENADENSLVLLDELGSGTDPLEGGAVAMAVLDELIDRGCFVILTTHHGAIKNYGYTHKNCLNASVEFSEETLCPTYKIVLGVPGSSHAIEIANRSGISSAVIEKAKSYINTNQADVATLIQGLTEKYGEVSRLENELKAKEEEINEKWRKVDLKKLQVKQHELELRKDGWRESKSFLDESRKMLENLVRELKEGEINREKTIKMKQTLEKIENAINLEKKDIEKEAESIAEKSVEKNVEFEVGDKVKFGEKRTSGIIVKKEKKGFYQVQVGSMKISMDGRKLEKVFDGGKKENNVTVEFEKENTKFFSSLSSSDEKPVFELRILGMRYEQAVKALEKQLDLCCINNFKNFSIVHGKGEGILQKAVWDCLSKYPFVESYNFAAPEDGGSGKTYVTMR